MFVFGIFIFVCYLTYTPFSVCTMFLFDIFECSFVLFFTYAIYFDVYYSTCYYGDNVLWCRLVWNILFSANKIHASDVTYMALSKDSSYEMEKRGEINIKVRLFW